MSATVHKRFTVFPFTCVNTPPIKQNYRSVTPRPHTLLKDEDLPASWDWCVVGSASISWPYLIACRDKIPGGVQAQRGWPQLLDANAQPAYSTVLVRRCSACAVVLPRVIALDCSVLCCLSAAAVITAILQQCFALQVRGHSQGCSLLLL